MEVKNYCKRKWGKIVRNLFVFMLFANVSALAFDGPTHKYVTEKSLETLSGMKKECGDFYTNEAKSEIAKYCVMPDEDENEGLFKDHFYNIATGRNFMGEKMSALLKFKNHYNQAVVNYKAGKKLKCWEELGRAIHFLEDLITPVHGGYDCPMDAVNKLPMHVDFEKKCVVIQNEYVAEISSDFIRYFVDNSLDEIGKMCSRIANDNFYALEKKYVPKEKIASNSILNAQKVVCGILYRFFIETQEINLG